MCGMPGMSSPSSTPAPMGGGMTSMSSTTATAGVNGTMAFSMNMMPGFFSPWGTYQLQLLFSTWGITEPWQFALSWIAVAVAAVVYQCLECVYHALEHGMIELLNEKSQRMQLQLENGELGFPNLMLQNQANENPSDNPHPSPYVHRPRGWQLVKLTLAFVAALRYTLGLMLMLGRPHPLTCTMMTLI